MSIDIIKSQITSFLLTKQPIVMAIRGAWGVGKTFTWNKFLVEINRQYKDTVEMYSYVSLFGVTSLDELKSSIFMAVTPGNLIGAATDLSARNKIHKNLISVIRKSGQLFKSLPYSKEFWPQIQSLYFYSVREAVICIDDFERMSDKLSLQDVMGTVLLLKEQRNCKVVLILNEDVLKGKALDEYKTYREKVIDVEIKFEPTASECIEIAMEKDLQNEIGDYIRLLNINNIRIIKKIEVLSKRILELLEGFEKEVIRQALQTAVLMSWCFYDKSKSAPDFNFIKEFRGRLYNFDNKTESNELMNAKAILRQYGYGATGPFDLEIGGAIERGFIIESSFLAEAKKLNVARKREKSFENYRITFLKCMETFDEDKDNVLKELRSSFKENIKYLGTNTLDDTVRLFRDLEEDKLADELIEIYIKERKDENELFNVKRANFNGTLKDSKLVKRFEEIYQEKEEMITIEDVIERIAGKDGWFAEDIEVLSNFVVDDYYGLLKKAKGDRLSLYIDTCLQFERIQNATNAYKMISQKMTEALLRISTENKLNAIRVGKYVIVKG